jgi:hypothetical protein
MDHDLLKLLGHVMTVPEEKNQLQRQKHGTFGLQFRRVSVRFNLLVTGQFKSFII